MRDRDKSDPSEPSPLPGHRERADESQLPDDLSEALDDLDRSLLETLEAMERVGRSELPRDTRLGGLKKLLLRLMAVYTRRQDSFNQLAMGALGKLRRRQKLLEELLKHREPSPAPTQETGFAKRAKDADRQLPGARFEGLKVRFYAPIFVDHDAVSNYLAEKCRILQRLGADCVLRVQGEASRGESGFRVETATAETSEANVEFYEYPGYYPLAEGLNAKSQGVVRVFDFHGVTPSSLWPDDSLKKSEREIRLARKADWVLVHSGFLEQQLIDGHGVDPSRIIRFPYSVDLEAFRPRPRDRSVEMAYGLSERRVLLYVGRIAPNKRLDVLVKGLTSLPDCTLVAVGDVEFSIHAEESERVRHIAEELQVGKRVLFTGRVSQGELLRLYSCADLLVSASLHEGFGIPFIEAMASGVPCVASHCTAIPETIGQAGRTFQPEDPRDFASKASELLNDRKAYQHAVDAGFEQVKDCSVGRLQANLAAALGRIVSDA